MGTVVTFPQRPEPAPIKFASKTEGEALGAMMAGHKLRLYPLDGRTVHNAVAKLSEAGLINVRPVIIGKDLSYWDITWTGQQPDVAPEFGDNVIHLTPPAPARRLALVPS